MMTDSPLYTLEIPNPFFEGRNRVYVIPSDPVTIIDTGVATRRAFAAVVDGLQQHGLSIGDVGRVVLTHKHIDHIGNAWRIQQESGAEILIHESEVHAISNVDADGTRLRDLVRERLDEWGVPAQATPGAESSAGPTWSIQPATATGVVDGQRLDLGCGSLEVVHTPGHTWGSICLKYGRRLLSGDHVLPGASPNVGGGDMRRHGLLKLFLGSLQRVAALADEVDLVFPGHGDPFDSLEKRCHELVDHHRQRLEKVAAILGRDGPQQVYQVALALFGSLRGFHIVLGCAEAAVHLEFLVDEGRVVYAQSNYRLP